MYDIALSVSACARSGTRADVVLLVDPFLPGEAVALTPGGGRMGMLASGAFDSLLVDFAARQLTSGRIVRHQVTEVEAALSGLPAGQQVRFMVIPADQFPAEIWPTLLGHQPIGLSAGLQDDVMHELRIVEPSSGESMVELHEQTVRVEFVPIPRLVIAGQGPIADALAAQGTLLGWNVTIEPRADAMTGIAATLSAADAVVVMGHDVESSSTALLAALESECGYIGALGSAKMQEARAGWLAYRDVTDLSRVHGPAGLDIGATTPAQIAVSITAEIIGVLR